MSETAAEEAQPLDEQQGPDPVEAELEQRARRMGWKPREEYDARQWDPSKWLNARDFVERGEQMLPLLQERARAADRTIVDLQQTVQRQEQTLNSLLQHTRNAERVGYRRAMQELHQKRNEAVERGDTQAFAAVEQAMRELGPEPPALEPQYQQRPGPQAQGFGQPQQPNVPPPDPNPVLRAWVDRNPWFRNDRVANVAMIAAMQEAERAYPSWSTEEHLMEAEAQMRRAFPQHFQPHRPNGSGNGTTQLRERRPMHETEEEEAVAQPVRRQMAAAVSRSSDTPPPRKPSPHSFEAIPAEHRAQYERQRRMLEGRGEPFTREEFAKYYFEGETE